MSNPDRDAPGDARYRYEIAEHESICEAVVTALARAGTEIQPDRDELGSVDLDLEPLYHSVDTEALDRIFEPTGSVERGRGTITFQYTDYLVTVDDRETVLVRPATESY